MLFKNGFGMLNKPILYGVFSCPGKDLPQATRNDNEPGLTDGQRKPGFYSKTVAVIFVS